MNFLKLLFQMPFLKSFVLGQARNGAAIAGGYFVTHGLSAGYSQDQIVGALCCMAAIAFQGADNVVVHGKLNPPVTGAAQ